MICRNLDSDYDWQFGRSKQDYLKNSEAIAMNIRTRLLSFFGDCFFDIESGVDWFGLLTLKDRDLILASIRKVIIESYGVIKINSLDWYIDINRKYSISYNVDTIFTLNYNLNTEVII